MKLRLIPVAFVIGSAGLAHAGLVTELAPLDEMDPTGIVAFTFTVDVSGLSFNDAQGSAFNERLALLLAPGALISGIGWDVRLTTIGASWASEAVLRFEDEIEFAVGSLDSFPVTNMNYTSGGVIDLTDAGFSNIRLMDSALDIEAYDSFVDNGGGGDAYFEAGSLLYIGIEFPTPGTLGMLGFGGLMLIRRRR